MELNHVLEIRLTKKEQAALYKITGHVSDLDMKERFRMTATEIEVIHDLNSCLDVEV